MSELSGISPILGHGLCNYLRRGKTAAGADKDACNRLASRRISVCPARRGRMRRWRSVIEVAGLIVAVVSCTDKEPTNVIDRSSHDPGSVAASVVQANSLSDPGFELAGSVWQKAT